MEAKIQVPTTFSFSVFSWATLPVAKETEASKAIPNAQRRLMVIILLL
jgi:hypothetical protein